jgi:2-polyprenyl-3-methyl-5-hydroxy-6-metoxy-1,4-benzoquinol methylase
MKTIAEILSGIETSLSKEEKQYFWTHSVRYKYILEKIQEVANGKQLKILDIGCFPYHVGQALEELGHTVYGISSTHEPIKKKHISVLNVETDKFPYQDNFFDMVLCNEVIEHLPQSSVWMLHEIRRVTKQHGFLMITTPNIARSINRAKLLVGKSIMYPVDVYFENEGKGNNIYHRHNREFTLEELKKIFLKTKWHIKESGYFISYTPFRKRAVLDSLPLFLIKYCNYIGMLCISSFQDTLIIIGEKQ